MSIRLAMLFVVTSLLSCATNSDVEPLDQYEEVSATTMLDAPAPRPGHSAPAFQEQAAHGEYLVELLGCAVCHSDGALVGMPVPGKALAGSGIGIAWSNPMGDELPGIVYPPNITPDIETGIGLWSDQQIANAIRSGIGRHGDRPITVMPWQGYARISDDDIVAITAYLRSIDPVYHEVPNEVDPGQQATAPYVYFGVYQRN